MRTPFLFVALALATACGDHKHGEPAYDDCGTIDELAHFIVPEGVNNGVFDPSLEVDFNGRAWMTFSGVDRDAAAHDHVSTYLAYSEDHGATWCHGQPMNAPYGFPDLPDAKMNHEVSSLVLDPAAPVGEQWRVFWHQYPLQGGERLFDRGAIGMRIAKDPQDLIGEDDPTLTIDPAPELDGCVVFTEPGALARDGRLLLALQCATGTPGTGRIVILELDRSSGHFVYRGTPLRDSDITPFSPLITGVAAPALVNAASDVKLLVSPTVGDLYAGCLDYTLDLVTFTVTGPFHHLAGATGELTGACEEDHGLLDLGLLVSQTTFASVPWFHILRAEVVW
jgi:hypothetical protein